MRRLKISLSIVAGSPSSSNLSGTITWFLRRVTFLALSLMPASLKRFSAKTVASHGRNLAPISPGRKKSEKWFSLFPELLIYTSRLSFRQVPLKGFYDVGRVFIIHPRMTGNIKPIPYHPFRCWIREGRPLNPGRVFVARLV